MMREHLDKPVPCSILVPVFNGGKHVTQGLSSIAASAREVDQIVVIDDGSTDETSKLVQKFAARESRILFKTREHFGLVKTLNFGIDCCDFELVARADIDDHYSPDRIDLQSKFLTFNPNIAAVFCDYTMCGENSEYFGDIYTAISPNLTELSLITSSRTPHPGVMYKKSVIKDLGGYRQENFPTEDLALWISIAMESQIGSLPSSLLSYTLNPKGISAGSQELMSSNLRKNQKMLVQNVDLEKVRDEISRLDALYSGTRGSTDRYLSLVRDLLIFARIAKSRQKITCIDLLGELFSTFDKNWITSSLEMRRLQHLRRKYRLGAFK